jgi:hypothetical protein
MNCDLENSFLLVYLSGPLTITHGPRGAAPAAPILNGPGFKSLCFLTKEIYKLDRVRITQVIVACNKDISISDDFQ